MFKILSASLITVALLLSLSACGSSEVEAFEEDWELSYQHSPEFMWAQAKAAMLKQFEIAEENLETHTLTSEWDEKLSIMSHHGFRYRLIVVLEGDIETGFKVKAKEEKEKNTEQVNPTASSEAEWEAVEADGGAVAKFRVALHRRLNPKERWIEASER